MRIWRCLIVSKNALSPKTSHKKFSEIVNPTNFQKLITKTTTKHFITPLSFYPIINQNQSDLWVWRITLTAIIRENPIVSRNFICHKSPSRNRKRVNEGIWKSNTMSSKGTAECITVHGLFLSLIYCGLPNLQALTNLGHFLSAGTFYLFQIFCLILYLESWHRLGPNVYLLKYPSQKIQISIHDLYYAPRISLVFGILNCEGI